MQLPIAELNAKNNTIGVWASVERRKVTTRGASTRDAGTWVQVNRLGNPLVNEVIIPTGLKDRWNALAAVERVGVPQYYDAPILAAVINKLYKLGAPETGRDDLVAVLLTGVPKLNYTGPKLADVLRLNLSIPVTANPNRLGVLAGDNQGWPNGRRLGDDVIDIAEQAVGGFLKGKKLPLGDGVDGDDAKPMSAFPYAADPDRASPTRRASSASPPTGARRLDRSGPAAPEPSRPRTRTTERSKGDEEGISARRRPRRFRRRRPRGSAHAVGVPAGGAGLEPPRGAAHQPRTRSPTTPTSTRSSAPTRRTRSRSSPTTSRSRSRPAGRTSTSSATTSSTRSTSTTTATRSEDVTYQFRFKTAVAEPEHVPLQHRPDHVAGRPGLEPSADLLGHASIRRAQHQSRSLGRGPRRRRRSNIGPRSTPNYDALAAAAVPHAAATAIKVFAGQRDDPFFVDLGSIFDLGGLRPFNTLHIIPLRHRAGRRRRGRLQHRTRSPSRCRSSQTRAARRTTEIGVYASASRQQVAILDEHGADETAPASGCRSRASATRSSTRSLIPLGQKDRWNASDPEDDAQFVTVLHEPELAGLDQPPLPGARRTSRRPNRDDLVAVLLTGVPGVQLHRRRRQADLLRLNTGIPPTAPVGAGNRLGVLGGRHRRLPERPPAGGRRHRHRAARGRLRLRRRPRWSRAECGGCSGSAT